MRPLALALLALLLAPAAAATPPRGLDAAPGWMPGEWWRVQVEDAVDGASAQGTLVVTSHAIGVASFGLANGSVRPILVNFHVLPLGDVRDDALAYAVHGETFDSVRFPLARGASWQTAADGIPLVATVDDAREGRATIVYRGLDGREQGRGMYDAQLGFFSQLSFGDAARLRVLDHGFAYACASTRLDDVRDVFVSPPGTLVGVPQAQLVTVRSDETLSLSTMLGGVAQAQAIAPSGLVLSSSATPYQPRAAGFSLVRDEPGVWSFTTAASPGSYVAAEAIGFRETRVAPFGDAQTAGDCPAAPRALASLAPAPPSARSVTARAALVSAGLLLLALLARRRLVALVAMLSKVPRREALAQPARARILALVAREPGLRTQDLKRALGVGWGTVVYHVGVLRGHGELVGVEWGRDTHWFARGGTPRMRALATVARRPGAQRVLDAVRAAPGIAQSDLSAALRVRHSTVIFHAKRLAALGLVEARVDAGRLRYFPLTDAA